MRWSARSLAHRRALRDFHLLAFGNRVGRIENKRVTGAKAGGDFEGVAVVLADGDGLEMHAAIAHQGNAQTFGTEEQRVRGNGKLTDILRELEVDEDVGARKELAFCVVDVDLDVERARSGIDGAGVACDLAGELLAGIFVESEGRDVAVTDGRGVGFRYRDKTRSSATDAMRKSSLGAAPLAEPASISAPISVLRTVTTPEKGAYTRSNDCSCCRRRTLACAASTAACLAAAPPIATSVSCLETESLFSRL